MFPYISRYMKCWVKPTIPFAVPHVPSRCRPPQTNGRRIQVVNRFQGFSGFFKGFQGFSGFLGAVFRVQVFFVFFKRVFRVWDFKGLGFGASTK